MHNDRHPDSQEAAAMALPTPTTYGGPYGQPYSGGKPQLPYKAPGQQPAPKPLGSVKPIIEDGWLRHSQYAQDEYHVVNCKAKAAAAGFPNFCVAVCCNWQAATKKHAEASCDGNHAANAPEHAAWGYKALMEAIWADPQCYRRTQGRRLAAEGRHGGKGAGGRGGGDAGRAAGGKGRGAAGKGYGGFKGGGGGKGGKGRGGKGGGGNPRGQVARR